MQIKRISFLLQLSWQLLFLVAIAFYHYETQHTGRFEFYNLRAHVHVHIKFHSNCARHNKLMSQLQVSQLTF